MFMVLLLLYCYCYCYCHCYCYHDHWEACFWRPAMHGGGTATTPRCRTRGGPWPATSPPIHQSGRFHRPHAVGVHLWLYLRIAVDVVEVLVVVVLLRVCRCLGRRLSSGQGLRLRAECLWRRQPQRHSRRARTAMLLLLGLHNRGGGLGLSETGISLASQLYRSFASHESVQGPRLE